MVVLLLFVGCSGGEDSARRALIQNKGSDTLLNVAQAWAEAYSAVNSEVAVAVTGGGSGTGISAMINGTVDIANSSRAMRNSEIEAARANGIEPVEFVVGHDALAIFMHENNPLDGVTMEQLRGIFGADGRLERWSDLGVTVPGCPSDEIIRVSRQNNSGTYIYFRETVLGSGHDFKLGSYDMHGSKDVVDLVEHTPCAIGYSGLAYATEHIHMPCVSSGLDAECVVPQVATAISGAYPISRPLRMYTAGDPIGAIREYMDWILSDDGQCVIRERGYASIREISCT